uniref:Ras-related protein Rab-14 n=1 Tax=Tetraodon nigroviridis TaxID=99883 RepID=H3DQP5_TETNG
MVVGEWCVVHQFTEKKFMADCPHTIGDHGAPDLGHGRAGAVQGRHQVLLQGGRGGPHVYDITRRSTYNHLSSWLTDARNLTNPNTVIILIGNKADLEAQRDVTYEEAKQFADENGEEPVRYPEGGRTLADC